jgi:hypothetical protein
MFNGLEVDMLYVGNADCIVATRWVLLPTVIWKYAAFREVPQDDVPSEYPDKKQ